MFLEPIKINLGRCVLYYSLFICVVHTICTNCSKKTCFVPDESDAAHVVFRVASGSGGDSSLFDLWSNNAVEPAANEGIDPAYFSRSAHASQKLMKSPIIDKAWEHVTEVYHIC